MHNRFTRRALINCVIAAGTLVPVAGLLGVGTALAAIPALDTNDPLAKSLGYITQSVKSDAKCSNCVQYHGKAGDAAGPCTIFPGKSVAAAGWCKSWGKQAAAPA